MPEDRFNGVKGRTSIQSSGLCNKSLGDGPGEGSSENSQKNVPKVASNCQRKGDGGHPLRNFRATDFDYIDVGRGQIPSSRVLRAAPALAPSIDMVNPGEETTYFFRLRYGVLLFRGWGVHGGNSMIFVIVTRRLDGRHSTTPGVLARLPTSARTKSRYIRGGGNLSRKEIIPPVVQSRIALGPGQRMSSN